MNTKVRIIHDYYEDCFRILVRREIAKETGEILRYFLNSDFKWTVRQEHTDVREQLPRFTNDDMDIFVQLYKELQDKCNFEVFIKTNTEKEVEATREHLNDMRAIVFKQLGIQTE